MKIRFLSILCVFGGLVSSAAGTTVWIDTDPSIGLPFRDVDDAFALILAFHSPELKIAGISTTYGNASLNATTRIARDLVAHFAKATTEVHPGARSPKDLGRPTDATDALARALQKDRLTYLALGPLTNLATFLRLRPELAERLDRIVVVGGQTSDTQLKLRANGWLRIHDANVFKGPAAANEVLKSKCAISLAPVETSLHLLLTARDLQEMRRTSSGDFLFHRTRLWTAFWRRVIGMEGGPLFDALAVLASARPNLVEGEVRYARMSGKRLIADATPALGKRTVCYYSAIKPSARRFVCERLAGP